MMRSSGVLMPIFSLPTKYGIGDFGDSAKNFIDILKKSNQKFWQVLPLVQTGFGNSPYSSIASDSFNPYFISPQVLLEKGLCTKEEIAFSENDSKYVDYGFLYTVRFPLLKKAFERFDKRSKKFVDFINSKVALDYALYMTIKIASGQKHFYEWEDKFKYRDKDALKVIEKDYESDILFWQFVQYEAREEWLELKKYANNNGISIIGDIPLYVALDSVDVWVNGKYFKVESDFSPKKVAGVPPDYFCQDGQLWGNPVYDYEKLKEDDFSFWTERLKKTLEIFDYVRIDHFRGLDRYYEIDAGAVNAINGEWIKVPSDELFKAIHSKIDRDRIIAEDLGIIDDGVRQLLANTGYPGMKILSFAFNGEGDNLYLPQNINENSVCYTGTHDNDTLHGFTDGLNEWDKNNLINGVKNSLKLFDIESEDLSLDNIRDKIIELGFCCKSKLFILPLSDILDYGTEYRINTPGTVKESNWAIRYSLGDIDLSNFKKIAELTKKYNR